MQTILQRMSFAGRIQFDLALTWPSSRTRLGVSDAGYLEHRVCHVTSKGTLPALGSSRSTQPLPANESGDQPFFAKRWRFIGHHFAFSNFSTAELMQ
jgi:hypothetical protein